MKQKSKSMRELTSLPPIKDLYYCIHIVKNNQPLIISLDWFFLLLAIPVFTETMVENITNATKTTTVIAYLRLFFLKITLWKKHLSEEKDQFLYQNCTLNSV